MVYSLKTISIGISGNDLIFEGLRGCFFQASYTFCYRFWGVPPGASLGHLLSKLRSLWDSVEFFLRYRLQGTAMPHLLLDPRIYDTGYSFPFLAFQKEMKLYRSFDDEFSP
jgi:hypothetical protein